MIGILLAGGLATRLGGGDKGGHVIGGRSLIDRVVTVMRKQCEGLIVNANGDPARFAALGLPVVADAAADAPTGPQLGPLAGVLAGLDHVAATHPGVAFAVTVPTDTPFLPIDLVTRLQDARAEDRASIVCARSSGRPHYVVALWAVVLRHDLRRAMASEDLRKVHAFIERHAFAYADWPVTPFDPFFNVNTPEDLAAAERIAAHHP